MRSSVAAPPVKYPLPAESLHVPCGFQCHASACSSVFWRYETVCQPAESTFSTAARVKNFSTVAELNRSIPAPSAWLGTNDSAAALGPTSTQMVCALADLTTNAYAASSNRTEEQVGRAIRMTRLAAPRFPPWAHRPESAVSLLRIRSSLRV